MKIELEHLDMTYPGGKRALQDISLTLAAPGLVGRLGPNGAGKSTLTKLLVAGLLPTAGAIAIDGQPLLHCEAAYCVQHLFAGHVGRRNRCLICRRQI